VYTIPAHRTRTQASRFFARAGLQVPFMGLNCSMLFRDGIKDRIERGCGSVSCNGWQ
jgi:hypothetical protein